VTGIRLTIPVPPTTNHYYAVVRGRKIVSKAGREWTAQAVRSIREQHTGPAFTGDVRIEATWYRERRSGDLSNRIKPTEDALQKAGVLENDSQIAELEWKRREDKANPRLVLVIRNLETAKAGECEK